MLLEIILKYKFGKEYPFEIMRGSFNTLIYYIVYFDLILKYLDILNEIDDYLCHVVLQIHIGEINGPPNKIHQHLQKLYLKNKKDTRLYSLFNTISSLDPKNQVSH